MNQLWPLPSFKAKGVQEIKHFCANYLIKFSVDLDGIWFVLRLVGLMNLILSVFYSVIIQGKEPCWCDFLKKQNKTANKEKASNVGLYSDISRPIV